MDWMLQPKDKDWLNGYKNKTPIYAVYKRPTWNQAPPKGHQVPEQDITHKGIPIRVTADLSIETLQARKEWQDILKVMKEKNLQLRLLYPARISFKYEREIKSFTDKQKLRKFSTTKPALQQMLKDLF